MKALLYEGCPGVLRYVTDYPVPEPAAGTDEVLLKIRLAGICNTDKEVIRGYRPDFRGVLGHEFVAEIVAAEDAAAIGRRVVGELNAGCGTCVYCRTGRESHCAVRKVPGMSGRDGCFAEYMTYPLRLLHFVADELPDEAAVLCEPLAAACRIPEVYRLPLSEPVAVVGDGRLAFLIAQVLAIAGRRVRVFGRHASKLERFRAFAEVSLEREGSFETVVEASGHPSGLADALRLTRSCGQIILKSTYARSAVPAPDLSEIVVRELRLLGSRCGPFAPALSLLSRGLIKIPPLERYSLENYAAALSSPAFKAVFDFPSAPASTAAGDTGSKR